MGIIFDTSPVLSALKKITCAANPAKTPASMRKEKGLAPIFPIDGRLGVNKMTMITPMKTPKLLTRYAAVGSTDESPIFSRNGTDPHINAVSKASKNASIKSFPQKCNDSVDKEAYYNTTVNDFLIVFIWQTVFCPT
ncbi:MAG: hypothetical protein QY305_10440 [Candidatus Brocadiaceae baterium WH-1]|nr:MAG: hypothetical protein QY305_10440 [Candidatus Jettenia sp. AMX2]